MARIDLRGSERGLDFLFGGSGFVFYGFGRMSKIVDDFMARVWYDGSMKEGQTRMAGANE